MGVYDSATKSVKLVFWKTYLEEYLAKDLQARRAKKMPDCTTVYDPQTQEAKLVTWEAYLRTHKPPPAGHYTTIYDPKSQSCKLVTWRDYLEYHKANEMKKPQEQQQEQRPQRPRKPFLNTPPFMTRKLERSNCNSGTSTSRQTDQSGLSRTLPYTILPLNLSKPFTGANTKRSISRKRLKRLRKRLKRLKKPIRPRRQSRRVPIRPSSMTPRLKRPSCSRSLSTSRKINQSGLSHTPLCMTQLLSRLSWFSGSSIWKAT